MAKNKVAPFFQTRTYQSSCKITCSTVVVQCYRRQAIPMEQAKIRPLLCTPWTDHYQTWCGWLRRRPLVVCQFWLNLVGWGIFRKYVKYNLSVTFCSVPFFSCTRLEQKPVNGFARSMAQNAWNQARMCLLGVSTKNFTPPPIFLKFWKFCITKAVFRTKHV